MEGGGEGLLSIVQGLSEGLAVLLRDRQCQELQRRTDRKTLKGARSSHGWAKPSYRNKAVDTSFSRPEIHKGAQISSGWYASTYQLAHCRVTPSPPPISPSEFPPQRPEPCRTQGNFEVGGFGSQECSRSLSPSPSCSPAHSSWFRGGRQWPDRGSVYSTRTEYDPDGDAFACSLRKYPSSAERSPSAELLQRILEHTGEKHSQKTPDSKNARDFKQSPTRSKNNLNRPSKNVQTYIKKKAPFKENESNTGYDRNGRLRQKEFRSGFTLSPSASGREIRARDTFDYLNSDIPRPPPGKASGDRRAAKNASNSRQHVFEDGRGPVTAYPMCSKMRSRYERHRREHHSTSAGTITDNVQEAHEFPSMTLKLWDTCGFPEPSTSFTVEPKYCRRCKQPVPCGCPNPIPCPCSFHSNNEMEEMRKLEDVIFSWLEELPVYAKENPHDKFIRDAVVKKLLNTLSFINDEDYDTKGKEAVKLCVSKMPMWLPSDEKESADFKNKIADDLFNKIKAFRGRDRLKDVIKKWLDGIKFDDSKGELDKENVANDLAVELKPIALDRPLNDCLYREKVKCKILDKLAALPIKYSTDKNDEMILLAEKLADDLVRLPKEAVKADLKPDVVKYEGEHPLQRRGSSKSLSKTVMQRADSKDIEQTLRDTLENIPELANLSEDEKREAIENILPKLKMILSNPGSENVDEKISDEIHNWLMKLADDKGVHVDARTAEKAMENLVGKLKFKSEKPNGGGVTENELIHVIHDWLKECPKAPDTKTPENKEMIANLANQIQEIQRPDYTDGIKINDKEESESEIIQATVTWLQDFNKHTETGIEPGTEVEFSKKLLPKIVNLSKPRKKWDKEVDYDPERRESRKVSFSSHFDPHNLTTDDPELKLILKKEVHDILDKSPASVTNRNEVESNLTDVLADVIMRGANEGTAKDQMLTILEHGNVSGNQSEDICDELLARANEMSRSYRSDVSSNFKTPPSATSTPQKRKSNDKKRYQSGIETKIQEWLKDQNLPINDGKRNEIAKDLANDLVDRQKYLQLNPEAKTSDKEELDHLKYQLFKDLNKLIDTGLLNKVMSKVPTLMDKIKEEPVPELTTPSGRKTARLNSSPMSTLNDSSDAALIQGSSEFVQENLEGGILNWLRKSSICRGVNEKQKNTQEQLVPGLAQSLTIAIKNLSSKSEKDADKVLLNEIIKHLNKFPLAPKHKSNSSIRKTAEDLLRYLKNLQLFQNISDRVDQTMDRSHMLQFNEAVKNWCDDLPLADAENAEQLKQDLSNKIILKIGELNMNPQIFNDDFLYEDILSDFIDEQLNLLPIQGNNTEAIKAKLLASINETRQDAKNELAGQTYKQQLCDTISKTLPPCTTEEEKTSFEIMKDNLADAFINLHHAGDDKNSKAKYKKKINDGINKFVDDYMSRHPSTPLSAQQLNKDLYSALKKVEMPGEESMKSQVEQSRMKDVINDWVDKLPLENQSAAEQLNTNKVMTRMAKELREIEKDNEEHPDGNYDERLKNEIAKHLKKIHLKPKADVDHLADQLIKEIKSTEHSRTFQTGSRRSIDIDAEESYSDTSPIVRPQNNGSLSCCTPRIPPCALSLEELAHLQRIRERNQLSNVAMQSNPCNCKIFCRDAAVNPPPLDDGSQTDVAAKQSQSCQCKSSKCCVDKCIEQPSSPNRSQFQLQPSCPVQQQVSTGSQIEIAPYVVIKEYFWDNSGAPLDRCQPSKCPTENSTTRIPSLVLPQNVGACSGITPPPCRVPEPCRIPEQPCKIPDPTCRMSPKPCRTPEQPCRIFEMDCRTPELPRSTDRARASRSGSVHSNDQHFDSYQRSITPSRVPCYASKAFDPCSYSQDQSHGALRPRIYRNNENQNPTERKGHPVKCVCKGKVFKCRGRKAARCQCRQEDPMNFCAKCCGTECPHPARFYFR